MAYNPAGDLLVGGYGAGAAGGAVLKFDTGTSAWVPFIAQTAVLRGAGNLLVNGNDLYVAAGISGNVRKYNATTAAIDPAFNINGLAFPASMTYNPGGGILVGILGATNGSGSIARYAYDGTLLGTFALNSNANPALGFREPTGLYYLVPEPASLTLAAGLALAVGCFRRRVR